jgi:hypothetical protein
LLCNSFTLFHDKRYLLQNPKIKNPEQSDLEIEGTRVQIPLFLSNDQETPCPEKHEHEGRSEVMHHLSGKMYHMEMTQITVLHHSQKSVTSHQTFLKKNVLTELQ